MPEIIVIDPTHVTIDGEPAGSVLDVAANYPNVDGIKGLVLDALTAWDAARQQANTVALAEKQALIDTLGGTELAQQMQQAAAIAAAQAALAKAQADLAALSG